MRKRLFSLALAVCLCMGLTVPAFADESDFLVVDGNLLSYDGMGGNVIIPDYVTSISTMAFQDCETLTGITIPSSVTKIGAMSFHGCKNLTNVNLPATLTDIGTYAFDETPWLKGLGEFAAVNEVLLAYQGNQEHIVIPDNISSFRNAVFNGNSNLKEMILSNRMTHISDGTFAGCNNLTSITIPSSVTSIGREAFSGCNNLKDLYFNGSETQWTSIKIDNTNEGNSALSKVTIHYHPLQSNSNFSDVADGAYYAVPVRWAVEKNITSGTSKTTFSPEQTCNRAQILTFLWRANSSPEPMMANPFTDIKSTDYYYKAALWAAEKGLVSGSTFGGSTPCTRAMTVEYLWKAAGSPTAAKQASFTDVPASADYAQAVAWAVEKGITSGTGGNNFSPADTCTRGQIVTFLHRAMA